MYRPKSGARILRLVILLALAAGCAGAPQPRDPWTPGRVFVLGLDGLDPRFVTRFEAEGLLPNFARLRNEGATGRVQSTIPMISPPAWTSATTGTPPGDHGIWSFWLPTAGDDRGVYVDATHRLAPAIWEDLTATGRSVGVVNVPVSCPPDSVNGFMIAGFPYPDGAPLTWPRPLEEEIGDQGYRRDAFGGPPAPGHEEDWLDSRMEIAEARRRIGLGLLFDRRPDFSFIVFTTPDRIQHHFWKFHDPDHPHHRADASDRLKNAVRDAYVWCDDVLGQVLDELPDDTTLIVLSDHGFGPAYLGVSKERVLARFAERGDLAATSRNLFGGDFYLPGADEEARASFAAALANLEDDSGRSLVRAVHDTQAREHRGFGGELGPDIVAEEVEGYLFVPGQADGPLVAPLPPTSFSGYHRRAGFFAARGYPIVAGEVRDCTLPDIPAMSLHLLGERIPRRYTQNVPRRLFPIDYFLKRPMLFEGEPRSGLREPGPAESRIDPAIEAQLQSLGYVQ
jgi:hypothetical protein